MSYCTEPGTFDRSSKEKAGYNARTKKTNILMVKLFAGLAIFFIVSWNSLYDLSASGSTAVKEKAKEYTAENDKRSSARRPIQ